jgi:hypothetical protein
VEVPIDVLVHNETLGLKRTPGHLLRISEEGYYELNIAFGENKHRVLLPIADTVIIQREAETLVDAPFEVER